MARVARAVEDESLLAAALKGLELEKQRIEEQIRQVRALLGKRGGTRAKASSTADAAAEKPAKKRELSAAARKRIAMAQKRRWAEYRKKGNAAEKNES